MWRKLVGFLNWVFNGEIGLGNDFRMGKVGCDCFWGTLWLFISLFRWF